MFMGYEDKVDAIEGWLGILSLLEDIRPQEAVTRKAIDEDFSSTGLDDEARIRDEGDSDPIEARSRLRSPLHCGGRGRFGHTGGESADEGKREGKGEEAGKGHGISSIPMGTTNV